MPLNIEDMEILGPHITHPHWPEPQATFYLKTPDGQMMYYSYPLHMDYTNEDITRAHKRAAHFFRARVGGDG